MQPPFSWQLLVIKVKPVMVLIALFALFNGVLRAKAPLRDSVHVFEALKKISLAHRIDSAYIIYRLQCRHISRSLAMQNLDELTDYARGIGDRQLEGSVFEMRADYFSVNRGFNAQSTCYYKKASEFALANNMIAEQGAYLHKTGMYYYVYTYNVEACKYFLQAQDVFKALGYDNVPNISVYLTQEASFYYDLGDYDNATLYLKEALKHPIKEARVRINTINTLGLICRNNQQFSRAINYFEDALKISDTQKDTAWVAIATGNIGSVYFLQGNYAKALPCILTDYNISLKYGEKGNAALALLRLVKINLVNNNVGDAEKQMEDAQALIQGVKDDLKLRIDLYDLRSQLEERGGRLSESIRSRKMMEQVKDSLQQRNNIAAVERVKLGFEMANHQLTVNKIKTEGEMGALRRNAVIMGLFLVVVISVLIYNQQLLKMKKDKKQLITEKQMVDMSLKNAESELLLYTESLRKKNVVIEHFRKEIDRLETRVVNKDEAEHLEKMMQAHIMTDENWAEFKALFAKVHTGFFTAIKKTHPGLSGTDIRILTLMKLQLSNREMANMLGITVEGIKKAKQRLRKKMNIAPDSDIEQAIASL